MAAPTVRSELKGRLVTAGTTSTVTHPATIENGDLEVLLFAADGAGTIDTPSGWEVFATSTAAQGLSTAGFYRTADGTEDSTTFSVTHDSEETAWILFAIENGGTPTRGRSSGASTTPAFPSHDHGSVADILWLAIAACDRRTVTDTTITSYTGNDTIPSDGANGVSVAWTRRAVLADQVEDPANEMTIAASDGWHGYTIAVPEDAGAGGRIMSSLAAHGGLAGYGGIAGQGGGLVR